MRNFIIFNTILEDGVGDFSHFQDIMNALLANPSLKDVEYTAIVYFVAAGKERRYHQIRSALESLGIVFYYGCKNAHTAFSNSPILQQTLRAADQAIVISFDLISQFYKPYLKPGIPIKYIGEHECTMSRELGQVSEDYLSRSMGLSAGCYGIKIKNNTPIAQNIAWRIIEENDAAFAHIVLKRTGSCDFAHFIANNVIVPAYFNKNNDFYDFLLFLRHTNDFATNKNIIIYLSGTQTTINSFTFSQLRNLSDYCEVIDNTSYIPKVPQNLAKFKPIKIVSGFYLTDLSFNALYQLAQFAGVSGDNTLERCISMDVLPYYVSSNWENKIATLVALQKITQSTSITLSTAARKAYYDFFDPNNYVAKEYSQFDLPLALKNWHLVTAYLRQHRNFYNVLYPIILEGIDPTIIILPKLELERIAMFSNCYSIPSALVPRADGMTLFFVAAQHGCIEVIKYLLRNHIQPSPVVMSAKVLRGIATSYYNQTLNQVDNIIQKYQTQEHDTHTVSIAASKLSFMPDALFKCEAQILREAAAKSKRQDIQKKMEVLINQKLQSGATETMLFIKFTELVFLGQPFRFSPSKLIKLALRYSQSIYDNIEQLIKGKILSGETENNLAITPQQIAAIIGHEDVVRLLGM